MTVSEMHLQFRQALDKVNSSSYPELLTEQVDYYLNEAQLRFIKTRYSGNNLSKNSFEQNQKRIDDLNKIVITRFSKVLPITYDPTTFKCSLSTIYNDEACTVVSSEKYMFYVMGRCKTSKTNCSSKYHNIRIYTHDELNVVRKNPFRKSVYSEPIGYFEDNNINIITEGNFTADVLAISFIKEPVLIKYGSQYPVPTTDVSCELSEQTHKEIIQLAVAIALENTDNPRLQTQMYNINNQE